MKLVKLADGRIIEITQEQFDILDGGGAVDTKEKKDYSDSISEKILNFLRKEGKISKGKMFNRFRYKKICFDNAVASLIHSEKIFITHEEVKHRFGTVEYLNIVE